MSNRPPNWYQMSMEEQRVWKNVETERENLEYNLRRAQEDSERERRRLSDSVDNWKLEYYAAMEELTSLREERDDVSSELQTAEQFIREAAQWDVYLAWRKIRMIRGE